MLTRASVPPMPSTTFVARRPGPFSALVQAPEIGGLRLEPLAPVRVHDRYYDTETGDLLRRGLSLRVREQGGVRTAGLRALGEPAGPLPDDLPLLGGVDGRTDARLDLPPGALDAAVRDAAGGDPLVPLLSLRQYRTPRVAYDGDARAGVLSFDVVVYEVPGSRVVSNEVEVRPGDGDPLAALAPVFAERGLERTRHAKVERAVLRLTRTLSQPVLLLPDEVRALERAAASDDAQARRRAAVVLLDARGFRPDTIAAQTGMSMARVRHWRQRFREVRLGVLDVAPAAAPSRRTAPRPAAVRPSEPSVEGHAPLASRAAASGSAETPPESPGAGGDGHAAQETGPADMAELLEMFSPAVPDTPHLGDFSLADLVEEELDDDGEPDDDTAADPEPVRAAGARPGVSVDEPDHDEATDEEVPLRLNPYPVVLGPVAVPRAAPRPAEAAAPFPPPNPPEWSPVPPVARLASAVTRPTPAGRAPSPFAWARPADSPRDEGPPSPAAPGPQSFSLGPLPETDSGPVDGHDPFAEVDLQTLRRDRAASRSRALDDVGGDGQPTPAPGDPAAPVPPRPPTPDGDAPLAEAARASLGASLAQFDAAAQAFSASRAPSDARRLLVAAHRLRVTVETFARALPVGAAARLVASLRPLAEDLDAGLDYARAASLADRPDLARLAADSVSRAAARLGSGRHREWGDRTRRLLDHLGRQRGAGVGDFAEVAFDDFVGQPGDAPSPTRLRHVLASALWSRFEAVRAFEDALDDPTPDLADHLAVALSALRLVVGVVEGAVGAPAADVTAALDAAEREVARTRHRAVAAAIGAGPGADLSRVRDVWSEITGGPFRQRLAAVAATV